jgi:hypothetical protein
MYKTDINKINISSTKFIDTQKLNDLIIGDDNSDLLVVNSNAIFTGTLTVNDELVGGSSGGGSSGGGGSGIVNNRIDGDLTIGEDDSDLLIIASKINVNGNEKILLDKPVLSDKGKIVTVNATGNNLVYGPQVLKHNINYKNIYNTGSIPLTASIANNNPVVHPEMNITITPQLTTSKIMITINIMGDWTTKSWDAMAYLKRTINGTSVDILPTVNSDSNRALGQFSLTYSSDSNDSIMESCNFHYIDEPNSISEIRYDVMLVHAINNTFYYNTTLSLGNDEWDERAMSFISVEEKFSNDDNSIGAITSFTQEQALAGAGGSAAFTSRVSSSVDTTTSGHWVKENLHDNNVNDDNDTTWATDNTPPSGEGTAFSGGTGVCWISYEFNTPQIITKYRLWPRHEGGATRSSQNIRIWELRVATDFSSYNRSDSSTYTVLDSQSLTGALTIAGAKSDWKIDLCVSELSSSNSVASNNLHLSNEYNLSTIGAYKFYELYITANYDDSFVAITEWALYGGGFTIPSQIGNSGKQLITNGSSLSWGSPASILVPSPVSNAGKVLKANAAGTGLEYGTSGKILQIQQLFYKHEKEGTNNTPVAVTPAFKQTILLDSTSNYVSVLAQISISADSGRCPDCRLVSHTYSSESNMNNHTSPTTTILGEATSAHIPGDYGVTGWLGGSYIYHIDMSNITREYIDLPGSLYVAYELYFCERRTNGTMWYLNRTRDVNVGDNDHNDTWGTCAISSMILKEFTNTPITTTTLE